MSNTELVLAPTVLTPQSRDAVTPLGPLKALYDDGKLLQAWRLAQSLGPMRQWHGTHARLFAGRLVTVFECEQQAGGAFRYAGKAPLFQEVDANPASFERYIDLMVRACEQRGVAIRYAVNVADQPGVLDAFDRIIIATGARYRHGLGPLVRATLDAGVAHWPAIRRLASSNRFRNWFYYQAREGTAATLMQRLGSRPNMIAIGDAVKAGKSKEAIASAFEAAMHAD